MGKPFMGVETNSPLHKRAKALNLNIWNYFLVFKDALITYQSDMLEKLRIFILQSFGL
jgi:hypothetical protein